MASEAVRPDRKPGWLQWLKGELEAYPGRYNLVLRAMLSSALVLIISMTLSVPFAFMSIIAVFFVTQANIVISQKITIMMFVATTVGIGSLILIFKLSVEYPLPRLLLSYGAVFVAMFLMRTTPFAPAFMPVAVVLIYGQTFVDVYPSVELVVRALLWLWVAINYATLVTLLVNALVLPAKPTENFFKALHNAFDFLNELLHQEPARRKQAADACPPGRTALTLQKLLGMATMSDQALQARQAEMMALVGVLERIHEQGLHLAKRTLSDRDDHALSLVLDACQALQNSVDKATPYILPEALLEIDARNLAPPLNEIRQALVSFANRSDEKNASQSESSPSLLVEDAFSNPVYCQFALKTLLSCWICQLFYFGTDWIGIHTIMITCVLVAQPSLGATQQKALLRLYGGVIGSALALISAVWIIPYLDDIVGLLLMTLPIIALSAWVMAGSERISYAGLQIIVTYGLAVLFYMGPITDLTEIRDRLIGIFLGIFVSSVVHGLLWPEAEGESLRQSLAKLIKGIGMRLDGKKQDAERAASWSALAECEAMAARVALEPDWHFETHHSHLNRQVQLLLANIRDLMMVEDECLVITRHHWQELTQEQQQYLTEIGAKAEQKLAEYADALANKPMALTAPESLLSREAVAKIPDESLQQALLRLSDTLKALPGWSASEAG